MTTHRMPNILTSVRHTKRHLKVKLFKIVLASQSHRPENAADSADVFTLSNITPHPEIFPFKPRGVFFLALQGAVLLHRIPFSKNWQSTQLKLGCINSRLHCTPCCNLQFFEIHWQWSMHWNFRENFTSSKESNQLIINGEFNVFHTISSAVQSSAVWTRTARSAVRI